MMSVKSLTQKQYVCGLCKEKGHNRLTCKKNPKAPAVVVQKIQPPAGKLSKARVGAEKKQQKKNNNSSSQILNEQYNYLVKMKQVTDTFPTRDGVEPHDWLKDSGNPYVGLEGAPVVFFGKVIWERTQQYSVPRSYNAPNHYRVLILSNGEKRVMVTSASSWAFVTEKGDMVCITSSNVKHFVPPQEDESSEQSNFSNYGRNTRKYDRRKTNLRAVKALSAGHYTENRNHEKLEFSVYAGEQPTVWTFHETDEKGNYLDVNKNQRCSSCKQIGHNITTCGRTIRNNHPYVPSAKIDDERFPPLHEITQNAVQKFKIDFQTVPVFDPKKFLYTKLEEVDDDEEGQSEKYTAQTIGVYWKFFSEGLSGNPGETPEKIFKKFITNLPPVPANEIADFFATLPAKLQDTIIGSDKTKGILLDVLTYTKNSDLLKKVVESKKTPVKPLRKLIFHPNLSVRETLSASSRMRRENAELLALDKSPVVRANVASSTNNPAVLRHFIMYETNPTVVLNALANPNVEPETFQELYTSLQVNPDTKKNRLSVDIHGSSTELTALIITAQHPNLPESLKEHIMSVLKDDTSEKAVMVRSLIKSNATKR